MNSEDDISNVSGHRDSSGRQVRYFESSITSNDSDSEMDKYLDEAMDSEEDADDDYDIAQNRSRGKESVSTKTKTI